MRYARLRGLAGSGWMTGLLVFTGVLISPALAEQRVELTFSTVWDVGPERVVCMVGEDPAVGAWDTSRAIRLSWQEGNVWSARIAMPEGTALDYKFISKPADPEGYCDPANVIWEEGVNRHVVFPGSSSPGGKTVHYLSALQHVVLHRNAGDGWQSQPMQDAGEGRHQGERLYRLDLPELGGRHMEFVFQGLEHDGSEVWDNSSVQAPYSGEMNYASPADVLWVQDGHVFNYRPAPEISPSVVITSHVASTVHGIPSRQVRIYLPRGYQQHSQRRYPVIYMHDGQNVFSPGGAYGSWQANETADNEIGQGRMRESIIVAVDNDGQNRIWEYLPPQDSLVWRSGKADAYGQFLIQNVKAHVDQTFRTRPGREDTTVIGSSMGGLVSAYLARSTETFKQAGLLSPAFTHSPGYTRDLREAPREDVRWYMDWGTHEEDGFGGDYWNTPARVYDRFLDHGYSIHNDLLLRVGCGHPHNEWAWAQRLPEAFRFLMDIGTEPTDEIPVLRITHPPSGSSVGHDASETMLMGTTTALEADFILWSNAQTRAWGLASVGSEWQVEAIALVPGLNPLSASAVNLLLHAQGAHDDADDPAYANGWQDGSQGGQGFGPWHLENGQTAGFFVATTAEHERLRIGPSAWGLWASHGHTAQARRTLPSGWTSRDMIEFSFQNNWIQSGGTVGWALKNTGGETLLDFFFTGGDTSYRLKDASGKRALDIAWTDQAFSSSLLLDEQGGYHLILNGHLFSGFLAGVMNPDGLFLEYRNNNAGAGPEYDLFISGLRCRTVHFEALGTDQTTITRAAPRAGSTEERGLHLSARPASAAQGDGILLQWESWPGEWYLVEKSHDLLHEPFRPVSGNVQATPPLNSLLITPTPAETDVVFYRIRVMDNPMQND